MFDFSLSRNKENTRTQIIGAYWKSFQDHYNIVLGDVITMHMFNDNLAEDEHVGVLNHEEVPEIGAMVFISVYDALGHIKPRIPELPG